MNVHPAGSFCFLKKMHDLKKKKRERDLFHFQILINTLCCIFPKSTKVEQKESFTTRENERGWATFVSKTTTKAVEIH